MLIAPRRQDRHDRLAGIHPAVVLALAGAIE
jgi:hypothetical protein